MKQKAGKGKIFLSVLLSAALLLLCPGFTVLAQTGLKAVTVSSPVKVGKDTKWSYVYFGSYPQSEVTGSALTPAITGANYSSSGDAWVDGVKYRRIRKSDTNYDLYFGSNTYRYFKWEKIKWRVVDTESKTSYYVLADCALDCKNYHNRAADVTWKDCSLRSWLNSTFYEDAFSKAEQDDIVGLNAKTFDNPFRNPDYLKTGGFYTEENISLLDFLVVESESDGFCEERLEESSSRKIKPSDYAHIMGALTIDGYCSWWLRSSGREDGTALDVFFNGKFTYIGSEVDEVKNGVVPVMRIRKDSNLLSTSADGGSTQSSQELKVAITADQKVKEKESVTFRVSVTGGASTSYKYQWYSEANGAPTKITGATSASYTTTALASDNGKNYYCSVSDGSKTVDSRKTKLTVYYPPTIIEQPQDASVKFGDTAEFSVKVSGGNPAAYTYEWYATWSKTEDGEKLDQIEPDADTIVTNVIDESLLTMNGLYIYCIVSNGQYKVTSDRALLLITGIREDQPAAAKKSQKITCKTKKIDDDMVTFSTKPFSLRASASGGGRLTYKSSNPKIAAVSSDGTITMKKYGAVTITVTAGETDQYKKASKKIKFVVCPKKMTITKKSWDNGNARFEWKLDKGVDGYEITYADNAKFDRALSAKLPSNKKNISINLGQEVYFSIRAYLEIGTMTYYGPSADAKLKR